MRLTTSRRAIKRRALGLTLALTLAAGGCGTGGYEVAPPVVVPALPAAEGTPARTIYVDGSLSTNPCTSYDQRSRQCGSGRELAFNNLADTNGLAQPGDLIAVREGVYGDAIAPRRSGTPRRPIVYRAYEGEQPRLQDIEAPALLLKNVSHIHVRGFVITDTLGWGRLENAEHSVIAGNDFREAIARGTTGGLKIVASRYNRVADNSFYRGNDSIVIQDSDFNVVTDNHFDFARHSLFSIRCGNYNVLRNNYFYNERHKAGEVYDCEGVSDAPIKFDVTKRNLIEGNHFARTRGSDRPTRYNGIQYAGQLGLIRRNIFINNEGGALSFAVYDREALHNYGNRVVQNWFFDNRCMAVSGQGGIGVRVKDNQLIGNVYHGNVDCFGKPRHVVKVAGMKERDEVIVDTPTERLFDVWVTSTTSAGQGTELAVSDPLAFFDGYGIPGEEADWLRIEGVANEVQLLRIDYEKSTLVLSEPVSWAAGAGVGAAATSARHPKDVGPKR